MVKDFFEDFKRQKSDKEENNRKVCKTNQSGSSWDDIAWKKLCVGDVVKIKEDEMFPADIVILSSSTGKGVCYVETKNLDGETNLKHKIASKDLVPLADTEEKIMRLKGTISCEQPNASLYTYEGMLSSGDDVIPLGPDQILLRGSSLRNTKWIIGVVVFTGHETKIMKNSVKAKTKKSCMEKSTMFQIYILFLLQVIVSLASAIFNVIWFYRWHDELKYLEFKEISNSYYAGLFFKTFGSWLLNFVYLIYHKLFIDR